MALRLQQRKILLNVSKFLGRLSFKKETGSSRSGQSLKQRYFLETEVGGTEEFFAPPTVARALQNKEKMVFYASSRNEFLYELKRFQRSAVKLMLRL